MANAGIRKLNGFANIKSIDFGNRRCGAERDSPNNVFEAFRASKRPAWKTGSKREKCRAEQGAIAIQIKLEGSVQVGLEGGAAILVDQQEIGAPTGIARREGVGEIMAECLCTRLSREENVPTAIAKSPLPRYSMTGLVCRYFG